VLVNETKPEFEGDYTIVLFSLVKQLKKAPDVLGDEVGPFFNSAASGIDHRLQRNQRLFEPDRKRCLFYIVFVARPYARTGPSTAGTAADHCRIRIAQHQ
jgi:hypothetical protein